MSTNLKRHKLLAQTLTTAAKAMNAFKRQVGVAKHRQPNAAGNGIHSNGRNLTISV